MKLTKAQIDLYKKDIVSIAEDLFYLAPEKPIKLWDFQREILTEINSKDEQG